MKAYLLVAASSKTARAFADLNGLKPADYLLGRNVHALDHHVPPVAILIEGWRARHDHAKMIQMINEAEVRGVKKIIEVRAKQILNPAELP